MNSPGSKRENKAAVAGMIAANIGFVVPLVGGLIGIALGVIGLWQSRDPSVGGRGLSIVAIILGFISAITSSAIIWWSLYGHSLALPG